MPKIHYFLNHGTGVWCDFSDDSTDALLLRFTPAIDGYVKVGDTVYRVKSGELSLPLAALANGTHELRVDTEGEGFLLEKFERRGASIMPSPTADSTLRALIARCRKNDQRLSALEEKISVLMKRTEGHHIFN